MDDKPREEQSYKDLYPGLSATRKLDIDTPVSDHHHTTAHPKLKPPQTSPAQMTQYHYNKATLSLDNIDFTSTLDDLHFLETYMHHNLDFAFFYKNLCVDIYELVMDRIKKEWRFYQLRLIHAYYRDEYSSEKYVGECDADGSGYYSDYVYYLGDRKVCTLADRAFQMQKDMEKSVEKKGVRRVRGRPVRGVARRGRKMHGSGRFRNVLENGSFVENIDYKSNDVGNIGSDVGNKGSIYEDNINDNRCSINSNGYSKDSVDNSYEDNKNISNKGNKYGSKKDRYAKTSINNMHEDNKYKKMHKQNNTISHKNEAHKTTITKSLPITFCDICTLSTETPSNLIIQCNACHITVHQDCYGIPNIDNYSTIDQVNHLFFFLNKLWFCRKCLFFADVVPRCKYCDVTGNAYKLVYRTRRFAHVLCAKFLDNIGFANTIFMEPIEEMKEVVVKDKDNCKKINSGSVENKNSKKIKKNSKSRNYQDKLENNKNNAGISNDNKTSKKVNKNDSRNKQNNSRCDKTLKINKRDPINYQNDLNKRDPRNNQNDLRNNKTSKVNKNDLGNNKTSEINKNNSINIQNELENKSKKHPKNSINHSIKPVSKICMFCQALKGQTIKCAYKTCILYYHTTCGINNGFYFDVKNNVSYCKNHDPERYNINEVSYRSVYIHHFTINQNYTDKEITNNLGYGCDDSLNKEEKMYPLLNHKPIIRNRIMVCETIPSFIFKVRNMKPRFCEFMMNRILSNDVVGIIDKIDFLNNTDNSLNNKNIKKEKIIQNEDRKYKQHLLQTFVKDVGMFFNVTCNRFYETLGLLDMEEKDWVSWDRNRCIFDYKPKYMDEFYKNGFGIRQAMDWFYMDIKKRNLSIKNKQQDNIEIENNNFERIDYRNIKDNFDIINTNNEKMNASIERIDNTSIKDNHNIINPNIERLDNGNIKENETDISSCIYSELDNIFISKDNKEKTNNDLTNEENIKDNQINNSFIDLFKIYKSSQTPKKRKSEPSKSEKKFLKLEYIRFAEFIKHIKRNQKQKNNTNISINSISAISKSILNIKKIINSIQNIQKNKIKILEIKYKSWSLIYNKQIYTMIYILDILKNNEELFYIFGNPVTKEIAPNYHLIIKFPMCINDIELKMYNSKEYTLNNFLKDIKLIGYNCRTFNRNNHYYVEMADKLESTVKNCMEKIDNIDWENNDANVFEIAAKIFDTK